MTTSYFDGSVGGIDNGGDPLSPASPAGTSTVRASVLSTKLTSVLSASYADADIREALGTLDARAVQNTAETRRQLRLDIQKEVIDCNGEIVKDFGVVAEVGPQSPQLTAYC